MIFGIYIWATENMVSIVSFSLQIAFFSSLDVYLSISTSIIFNNIIRRFVLILNCTWRALYILFILGFYSARKLSLHCILYYCIYFVYSVLFFSSSNYLLYVYFFSENVFLVPSHVNTYEQMIDSKEKEVSLFSFPYMFTTSFSN